VDVNLKDDNNIEVEDEIEVADNKIKDNVKIIPNESLRQDNVI
jgi:hypothetical protein